MVAEPEAVVGLAVVEAALTVTETAMAKGVASASATAVLATVVTAVTATAVTASATGLAAYAACLRGKSEVVEEAEALEAAAGTLSTLVGAKALG